MGRESEQRVKGVKSTDSALVVECCACVVVGTGSELVVG